MRLEPIMRHPSPVDFFPARGGHEVIETGGADEFYLDTGLAECGFHLSD